MIHGMFTGQRVCASFRAGAGLLLAGCSDYSLQPHKDVADGSDEHDSWAPDGDVAEIAVCRLGEQLPRASAVDESCHVEPQTGTLDAVVEWSITDWGEAPEFGDALTVPVVGQLTDDDENGRIDSRDIPDIVVVTDDDGASQLTRGVIRVVTGDGSGWSTISGGETGEYQVFPYRYSSVALADVDADGLPDIVGIVQLVGGAPSTGHDTAPPPTDTSVYVDPEVFAPEGSEDRCFLGAWTPDGGVLWVADANPTDCAAHSPAVADLEGDGSPEVVVGSSVFDGATGDLLWQGATGEGRYLSYAQVGDQSFAIDLDGDGLQEVIAGSSVYEADGRLRCTVDPGLDDGFPAAADFDGDALGEFVLVGNGTAHVHDDRCALSAFWPLNGSGNGGPPTIADFDGDGSPEIGVAEATTYSVYEADGTTVWSMPTTDASSHATGSSVFDFDGDGRAEVVYGDETTLWIFDGATGAVRLQDAGHSSRTLHEYPVVADVDGDGQEEIIVGQGGGHYAEQFHGLYVLGSASGGWLGDRQVWNQHAYSITNINDDLSVPAPAASNWPTYNTFRSGDLSPLSGGATPDAIPYVTSCADPCVDGRIELRVRIGNGGSAWMRGAVPVSVYAQVGTEWVWLATRETEQPIAPGWNGRVIAFGLRPEDVPEGVVWVVVDDANGVQQVVECHEDNNEARLGGLFCGE
jgi:hypothetical protein